MVLGSGIRKKPIPDPGSRGQKATDPGSRIRIRNTAGRVAYPEKDSLSPLISTRCLLQLSVLPLYSPEGSSVTIHMEFKAVKN